MIHLHPANYLNAYLAETVIDSVLQLGVLVELTWSVLRPFRASLPGSFLLIICASILILGGIIWPLSTLPGFDKLGQEWHLLLHLQRTITILRIAIFLALAGCSRLLSIGWRDRELQVATGLGFYSLGSLTTTFLQSHQTFATQYVHLNEVAVVSYLISLLYWVVCFAQKEPERQPFTPRMESLLLSLAGGARTTRIALAARPEPKPGRHPDL